MVACGWRGPPRTWHFRPAVRNRPYTPPWSIAAVSVRSDRLHSVTVNWSTADMPVMTIRSTVTGRTSSPEAAHGGWSESKRACTHAPRLARAIAAEKENASHQPGSQDGCCAFVHDPLLRATSLSASSASGSGNARCMMFSAGSTVRGTKGSLAPTPRPPRHDHFDHNLEGIEHPSPGVESDRPSRCWERSSRSRPLSSPPRFPLARV